ncbi:hypothetical protein VTL71DRAFT_10375 [Oculimacula yallundae]|uniref:Uncharacterized protein n=1 Tax=Oculimacula yallundae TaxID=86028 RepID=A0ABR4CV43_9HELO
MASSSAREFLSQSKNANLIVQESQVPKKLAAFPDTSLTSSKKNKKTKGRWIPLTEFPLFLKLALELRLIIWEMSIETQRVVISSSPVGLQHAAFGNNLDFGRSVYFNFSKDALEFSDHNAIDYFFGSRPRYQGLQSLQCLPLQYKTVRGLKHNLKYLIVDCAIDWYTVGSSLVSLFNNQEVYDHVGQPRHIIFSRSRGFASQWGKRSVKSIQEAPLQGIVGSLITHTGNENGDRGGAVDSVSAKSYSPTDECLTFKRIKERIHDSENDSGPPNQVYKAGMANQLQPGKYTTRRIPLSKLW